MIGLSVPHFEPRRPMGVENFCSEVFQSFGSEMRRFEWRPTDLRRRHAPAVLPVLVPPAVENYSRRAVP